VTSVVPDKYNQETIMKTCVCGYTSSKNISQHATACVEYKKAVDKALANASGYIEELYLNTLSVSACVDHIMTKEGLEIAGAKIRKWVDARIDERSIRVSALNKKHQQKKQEKIRQTTRERYGVDNIGQIPGKAWSNNSVPYERLSFVDDLAQFRKDVGDATWNTFMRMSRRNEVPTTCHYTNITFNDDILERVNPNDPYKRTIDHIVPVTEAFFKGWSVEKTSSQENLVFCLRVINTLKSNTNHDDFVTNYLPYIKEKLHESKISKEVDRETTSV